MSGTLLGSLGLSLLLTLVLETGFFLLTGKRGRRDLLLVVLVNVLTNPVVVLAYWLIVFYTSLNHVIMKAVLELAAVLAEGYYYKKYGQAFQRPFLFSFAANAFSFGIGLLLQQLL